MASRLRENRRANICGDAVWSTTRSSGRCALHRCPIHSHMRRICFSSARALDTGEYGDPKSACKLAKPNLPEVLPHTSG